LQLKTDNPDIHKLEAHLQSQQVAKEIPATSISEGPTTRRVDNSSKYVKLLSKKSREEREERVRETFPEEPIQLQHHVIILLIGYADSSSLLYGKDINSQEKGPILNLGNELQPSQMKYQQSSSQDFQRRILLMLWILLIHVNGNKRRLSIPIPVYPYMNSSINGKESKLTPYMLKKCKVMETHFNRLFSDPLQPQLEDFLQEKFNNVKNMNEVEFMRFLINQ